MTDGRIPGKWISEPRFAEMSVDAWCIFTKAIAWSNEAGTDGLVKRRYLGQLHPSGEVHPKANEEIASLGLWVPLADGYQFAQWSKPAHQGGLGQSTAESVKAGKDFERERSQRRRDHAKGDHGLCSPSNCKALSGGQPQRSNSVGVGQDRTGQAFDNEVVSETVNKETGELTSPQDPWKNIPMKQQQEAFDGTGSDSGTEKTDSGRISNSIVPEEQISVAPEVDMMEQLRRFGGAS